MGYMGANATWAEALVAPLRSRDEMDLFSDLISVADLEDSLRSDEFSDEEESGEDRRDDQRIDRSQPVSSNILISYFLMFHELNPVLWYEFEVSEGVCLSATGLGLLLSFIVLVFLMALTVSCLLCIQRHTANPLKPYNVRS